MAETLTREQFRRWSETEPRRYERLAGVPVAMSPERVAHARIKSRVWAALDRAIRAGGLDCEALPDGITVEIDQDTDFEPDAVVNRGARLSPDAIAATNPVIVVEVLSPATQAIDVGDKLAEYFRVPAIQHYLVVRARRREVIHHRRAGTDLTTQVITDGPIRLDPPGIVVEVAEFYPDDT